LIGGHVDALLRGLPLFGAIVTEEIVLTRVKRKGRAHLRGYDWRDTGASLAMGFGSIVFVGAIHLGMLAVARVVYDHRIGDVGAGVLGWSVAIVGWDFVYYWHHRWEHKIRLLWAGHVSHHSSERFNYSTALRQSWTTWPAVILYPMLAFVGVKPGMILFAEGVNFTYQFWVHTEVVGRLPGWFELVFNTPSHHRVHHGSNPQYFDKNYAGILMWDRLFGTFEPEAETVVYGLSKNVHTFNPLRIAFHEYAALWRDVRGAGTWRDRIGFCVHGKSWQPALPEPQQGAQLPDEAGNVGSAPTTGRIVAAETVEAAHLGRAACTARSLGRTPAPARRRRCIRAVYVDAIPRSHARPKGE
jgi:sterol desaturase/sphingolipid hydroxylase (fatty acid hydroxylase superfamily)